MWPGRRWVGGGEPRAGRQFKWLPGHCDISSHLKIMVLKLEITETRWYYRRHGDRRRSCWCCVVIQCPVAGHVSTHFHWPGSGAGRAHYSIPPRRPPSGASRHYHHHMLQPNTDKYTTSQRQTFLPFNLKVKFLQGQGISSICYEIFKK